MKPITIECHVVFDGLVQGVFFRKTLCRHAKKHGLVGTVQNLDDGRVELIVQGTEKEIEKFLSAVDHDHKPAQIDHIQKQISPIKHKYLDFQIIQR